MNWSKLAPILAASIMGFITCVCKGKEFYDELAAERMEQTNENNDTSETEEA